MPATIGSTTIGSAAITGNPPAGQRGKVAVIPRYKVRIVDPVSGAVVIDPLPYTHMSEFENIAPQSGMSGSSTVGHFVIHLFHPLTDQYAWNKVWYDKLDHLQRVEFYLIDEDGVGAPGDPVFTGTITSLPKEDFSYRIEGQDSLMLLDMSRTLTSDTFSNTTDALVKYALKTYQLTKGDDWNADLSLYTNNGSWTLGTDQGFKSVKAGFAGDGLLVTNASYTNAQYADCFVEAPFHLTCGSAAGNQVDGSLVAAVSDVNNLVLGGALMRYVAAGRYEIDAQIWQKVGGSYGTVKAQTQAVVVENTPSAQVTVTLIGQQTTATTYTWRLLVNEIDSKCVWVQSVSSGSPTGGIGVRTLTGNSSAVQHHMVFMSKANAFQPGNIAVGSQTVNQPIPNQSNIDLLQLAASTEGWTWRKRPKAGLNNDVIDYALSTGSDLSGIVRLEQDITIVSSQTERNAEQIATGILTLGQSGYNGLSIHRWYDIATMKTRGVVMGPAVALHPPEPFALRQMAQNILLKRKQPTQAKRMTVLRSEDHAELPGQPTPTGLAYRDGDWVIQHEPRKGINYTRVQIMSAKCVEGVPTMDLTLDQYPVVLDREPLVDRLNSVAFAAQMRLGDQMQANSQGVKRDQRMVLPINPWKMRATMSGDQTGIVSSTFTTVNFDTVTALPAYDTSNSFNSTTHQFSVPVAGYYQCSSTVDFTFTGVTDRAQTWGLQLYVNGAIRSSGANPIYYQDTALSTYLESAVSVSDCFYMNAGDLLDVRIYGVTNSGNYTAKANGAGTTFFSVHLVSG